MPAQILHCVMFPRLNYDLPILGMDMVGKDDIITLAITDFSPVACDRSLPPDYAEIAQYVACHLACCFLDPPQAVGNRMPRTDLGQVNGKNCACLPAEHFYQHHFGFLFVSTHHLSLHSLIARNKEAERHCTYGCSHSQISSCNSRHRAALCLEDCPP